MRKSILSLFILANVVYGANLLRNSNGVVTDSSTSLQWQDNISSVLKTWNEAISYCENLTLDGNSDWRLPNKNELLSIVDYNKYNPAIKENIFQNITSSQYWSSTTNSYITNGAWCTYFLNGLAAGGYSKTASIRYVRCVRGGQ